MNISKLNVLNIETKNTQLPKLGGGGVEGSYSQAEGTVFVSKIEVDKFYYPELSYQIFDNNGDTDAFGDPLISFSGNTHLTNIEGKYFIIVEQTLEGIADPNNGSMNFTLQFTNAEEDIGIPLNVSLIVTDQQVSVPGISTTPQVGTCPPSTCPPSICPPSTCPPSICPSTQRPELTVNVEGVVPIQRPELTTYVEEVVPIQRSERSVNVEGVVPIQRPELTVNVEEVVPIQRPELTVNVEEVVPIQRPELTVNVEGVVPIQRPELTTCVLSDLRVVSTTKVPEPTVNVNKDCAGVISCVEKPGAGCRQTVDETAVPRLGDCDYQEPTAITEEEYLGIVEDEPTIVTETEESTATTEEEYLGIETEREEIVTNVNRVIPISTTEEPTATTEEEYLGIVEDEPSFIEEEIVPEESQSIIIDPINVATGQELKDALGKAPIINIVSDIALTEFLYIPGNTTIRGINNPRVLSTAGAAFLIREDNITLTGFTLANADGNNGYGIEIGRKGGRASLNAPKNIIINSLTFDGIAGSTDKAAAINVSGYQFVSTLVEPFRTVPGLLEGASLIKNVKITNNIFKNIPNTALEIWNAEDVVVDSNIFETTRGTHTTRGNAVRANSLVNARFTSNTLKDIGRSGIEITGNGTVGVLVQDNKIEKFGTQTNLVRTFTSGITIVQGANEVTIKDNTIEGSGKGGGVEMAQNSSNFLIENNTISNVNKGIAISAHVDSFNVKNNIINYIKYGIQTYQAWNGRINSNILTQPDSPEVANPAISIEQSNGIVVVLNTINGDFYESNDEKAILVYANYPTQESKLHYAGGTRENRLAMLDYARGIPNIYDQVYKPAASKVDDVIANTLENNIVNGDPDSRVFFSQSSRVVLPSGVAGTTGRKEFEVLVLEQKEIIEIIDTSFNTAVINDTGTCQTIQEVIVDNQNVTPPEEDTSTVLIEEDKINNTVTFTTVETVETVNKDDLNIVTVDVDPTLGFCSTNTKETPELPTTTCTNLLVNCVNIKNCGSLCITTIPVRNPETTCQVDTTITFNNDTTCSTGSTCEVDRTITVDTCEVKTCDTICIPGTCVTGPTLCNTIDICETPTVVVDTIDNLFGTDIETETTTTCKPPIIVDQGTCIDVCAPGPTTCLPPLTTDICDTDRPIVCLPGPFDIITDTEISLPGPTTDIPDITTIPEPTTCIPTPTGGCCPPTETVTCVPRRVCIPGPITPPVEIIPPPVIVDPPITFPPPIIFTPPPEIPPFIPADCGKPPIPRVGVPVGEDPIVPVVDTPEPEVQPPVIEAPVLLYPAPVLPLTPPFLSNINFNTNITKKTPTPYSFEDEESSTTIDRTTSEDTAVKQQLCDDEEDCDTLGF